MDRRVSSPAPSGAVSTASLPAAPSDASLLRVYNSILFNMPAEDRWEAAARLLGVDVNLLSSEAGHA